MSSANWSLTFPNAPDAQHEVDEELHHIRDLVFVRELLSAGGATAEELKECDAVIDGVRGQLAESTKRASARYATAAYDLICQRVDPLQASTRRHTPAALHGSLHSQ